MALMDEIYGYPRTTFLEIYGSEDPDMIRWWKTRGGSFVDRKGGFPEQIANQLVDLRVLTHVENISPKICYVGITCPKGVALLWDAQNLSEREMGGLTLLRGGKDPEWER